MPALGLWTPDTSAYLKVAIGAAALGVVAWSLARSPRPPGGSEAATGLGAARSKVLAVLGFLGLLAYFNFGSFHFQGIYVHLWDSLHHVLGAKYIDELGYDGLYECIAVADAEDPHLAARAGERLITDLRTNRTVTAAEVVAHPERCRARFSDPRWASFKTDVNVFRARFPDADWQKVTGDHGFNASPVWVLAARPFVASAPITDTRLAILASIDPVLMLAAFAALAWAFGFERAALAAIVWGTYFPARLWWTGGSFLRWDWLAALLGGVALCRRGRPVLAGVLIGYAALSRVFPGFALVGVALAIATAWIRRRPLQRDAARVLAGAAIVASVLVPLSSAVADRPIWYEFARNLAKHTSVPSPNRMGLATILTFDPGTSLQTLERLGSRDARSDWEAAHARALRDRRGWWLTLALGWAAAVALATRDEPTWTTCLLGLLLLPFGTPLACYYYAFVAGLPLLSERRPDVAAIVLALSVASAVVARLSRYAMDDQYAAQSLLVTLALAFVVSSFLTRPTASANG